MNRDKLRINIRNWGGLNKLANHPFDLHFLFTASWNEVFALSIPQLCIWPSLNSYTTLVRSQLISVSCYFESTIIFNNDNKDIVESNQN